jgi:hypothetical protein
MNYRKFTIGAGLCVLLAPFFLPSFGGQSRWFQALSTVSHVTAFAAVAVLAIYSIRTHRRSRDWTLRVQYAAAFGIAIFLGTAVEFLQYFTPRDAELGDLLANAYGAWAGLAGYVITDARIGRIARARLAVTGIIPLILVTAPVALTVAAYGRRAAVFPALADYSQTFDDYFLRSSSTVVAHELLPDTWAAFPDERALHVRFDTGRWPGISYQEPVPDWADFDTLALDLTNPNDMRLDLQMRIRDANHDRRYADRFKTTIEVEPQRRSVIRLSLAAIEPAPGGRELDLTRISALILFVSRDALPIDAAGGFYLSRIWLE